jgi:hypothetical protein
LAGRASIGGEREVLLACLVAGRLAAGMLNPFDLTPADAKARAMSAKQWFSSLSLPAAFRHALAEVPEAVSSGNRGRAASALAAACQRAEPALDEASIGELRSLIIELRESGQA